MNLLDLGFGILRSDPDPHFCHGSDPDPTSVNCNSSNVCSVICNRGWIKKNLRIRAVRYDPVFSDGSDLTRISIYQPCH